MWWHGSGLPCPIQGFIITSPGRTKLSVEVLVSLKEEIGLPGFGLACLTEQPSSSEMLSEFGYLPETPHEFCTFT